MISVGSTIGRQTNQDEGIARRPSLSNPETATGILLPPRSSQQHPQFSLGDDLADHVTGVDSISRLRRSNPTNQLGTLRRGRQPVLTGSVDALQRFTRKPWNRGVNGRNRIASTLSLLGGGNVDDKQNHSKSRTIAETTRPFHTFRQRVPGMGSVE